jgi:hypothetical protein
MHQRKTSSVSFACFAILIWVAQLVIAGGHIHLAGSSNELQHLAKTGDLDGGGQSPARPHSGHDDFCPLCWAHGSVNSLLLSATPTLQHPAPVVCSQQRTFSSRADKSSSLSAFNPRGPPMLV